MEPEKLKIIAEGMGKDVRICDYPPAFKGKVLLWENHKEFVYTPLTNNDQMVEIMEKLKTNLINYSSDGWECYTNPIDPATRFKGKSVNEAVCNAAYEYFKKGEGE